VAFNNFSPSGLLPTDALELQIDPAVEIKWNSEQGVEYQVQWRSSTGQDRTWRNLGGTLIGTGGILSRFDSHHEPQHAYRLVVVN
jgi:hypothetical protein